MREHPNESPKEIHFSTQRGRQEDSRSSSLHHEKVQAEVLEIFKSTSALLEGHFILRSGLHSRYYFQSAIVCQYMDKVQRLAELLIQKITVMPHFQCDTIISPAMGGLVIGQEVARQLKKRFIFVEKVADRLSIRRGFKIHPQESLWIIEDVVTRGGRVHETLDIIKQNQGQARGIACLVDRSGGNTDFPVSFLSLINLNFPTFEPNDLPKDLEQIPAVKPGS